MSREKGAREERRIMKWFQDIGLPTRRTAASGAQEGHDGDFEVTFFGHTITGEGKSRATGLRTLYKWIEGHHFLTFRNNGKPPLVILTDKFWEHIVALIQQQQREIQALQAEEKDPKALVNILGDGDE